MPKLPPELWLMTFEILLDTYPLLDSSPIDVFSDNWGGRFGHSPVRYRHDIRAREHMRSSLALVCKAWRAIAQRVVSTHYHVNSFEGWMLLEETVLKNPRSLPQRIQIHPYNDWPRPTDKTNSFLAARPFRTISQNLRLLLISLSLQDDAKPIVKEVLNSVAKSLELFYWNGPEERPFLQSSSFLVLQQIQRFEALRILVLILPEHAFYDAEIAAALPRATITLPHLHTLSMESSPVEDAVAQPIILSVSRWIVPSLEHVSIQSTGDPSLYILLSKHCRQLKLVKIGPTSHYPNYPMHFDNLEHFVSYNFPFSSSPASIFPKLKRISMSGHFKHNPGKLLEILNMGLAQLDCIRLLDYWNGKTLSKKPPPEQMVLWRRAVEECQTAGVRLEEGSGKLLRVPKDRPKKGAVILDIPRCFESCGRSVTQVDNHPFAKYWA
jgi:hypothetical protein